MRNVRTMMIIGATMLMVGCSPSGDKPTQPQENTTGVQSNNFTAITTSATTVQTTPNGIKDIISGGATSSETIEVDEAEFTDIEEYTKYEYVSDELSDIDTAKLDGKLVRFISTYGSRWETIAKLLVDICDKNEIDVRELRYDNECTFTYTEDFIYEVLSVNSNTKVIKIAFDTEFNDIKFYITER